MWIRRYLHRHISRLSVWLISHFALEETKNMALAKASIFALHEPLLIPFNHRAAQQLKFDISYQNVLQLVSILQAACYAMEHNQAFDIKLYPSSMQTTTVEGFFLDEQQRYITPALALAQFKKQATSFIELYYQIEHLPYGVANFNQRVLSRLLKETLQVAQTLKELC